MAKGSGMSRCVTCGVELHPERAKKYDYCLDPDCQARNPRGLTIASVGVNKAADRFVILDERTEEEMAAGRYLDPRRASSISHAARPRRNRARGSTVPTRGPTPSGQPAESWTEAEQNLALALHVTGRKTLDQIAERLKLRPDTIAKMIATAKERWNR